jgi:tetratricopeptide (TPR) repeat protein
LPVGSGLKSALRAINSGAFDRAIDLLLGFVNSEPESSFAWQLLAWANYRLERFDEALSLINRALKLRKEPQFELVRACILAEKGIHDRSKSELRLAESLFRAGLSESGDQKWMVHYNLGNVLGALKKLDEAIEQYKSAIKLERNRPEIWKNLGSAYHEFGDHTSEMKCLDKALELDPLLPEALASKAISFIIDQSKPQEAVPLLEAALRSQPNIVNRWPKFWYWLATGCVEAGQQYQAFEWVEEGLSHQPGSNSLNHLKSTILAKLQHYDSMWASKARTFWTDQLTAEAMNFEARRQLAHAEILTGNTPAAWKLVDNCFPLFGFEPSVSLQVLELDLAQCIDAVEFLPEYTRFRSSFPVSDLWEGTINGKIGGDMNLRAQSFLSAYLAIPFGIGYRYMKDGIKELTVFFDSIRKPLISSFVCSAREYSPMICSISGHIGNVSKMITEVGALLATAAQYEFTHQSSWIPGFFELRQEDIMAAFVSYPRIEVATSVLSESVIELVRVSRLLSDEARPKSPPVATRNRT